MIEYLFVNALAIAYKLFFDKINILGNTSTGTIKK